VGARIGDLVGALVETDHFVEMGRQLHRELSTAAAHVDSAVARQHVGYPCPPSRHIHATVIRSCRAGDRTRTGDVQLGKKVRR